MITRLLSFRKRYANLHGKLAWISDPVSGSQHDNYCQEESGVLLTMNPENWTGDKGYVGNGMI